MKCAVCGSRADIHHIVHRREGGMNFELNYKYLCHLHHRGLRGPHRNKIIDYEYKFELQNKFESIFTKEFYTLNEINQTLKLSISNKKRIQNNLFLYKEGYSSIELIKFLMGGKVYSIIGLEDLILNTAILLEKSL